MTLFKYTFIFPEVKYPFKGTICRNCCHLAMKILHSDEKLCSPAPCFLNCVLHPH